MSRRIGHRAHHPAKIHEERTFGQRAADACTAAIGSWPFLILQSLVMAAWIAWNAYVAISVLHGRSFDPFPFILLNLALSTQAAIAGPLILLSSSRLAEVDRQHAEAGWTHLNEVNAKQDRQLRILDAQTELAVQQHREMLAELSAALTLLRQILTDRTPADDR